MQFFVIHPLVILCVEVSELTSEMAGKNEALSSKIVIEHSHVGEISSSLGEKI